jgi:hypothetical protein
MAKLFQGKDDKAEEMAEAKALKNGKITKGDYVKGETSEGHSKGAAKKADMIKKGKMTPAQYAAGEGKERKMADGGMVCTGYRSAQDYGKK